MLGKSARTVYNFIVEYNVRKGYSPTIREICAELGYKSTASVTFHTNNLVEAGLLKSAGTRGLILNGHVMISEQELSDLKKKADAYDELMKE